MNKDLLDIFDMISDEEFSALVEKTQKRVKIEGQSYKKCSYKYEEVEVTHLYSCQLCGSIIREVVKRDILVEELTSKQEYKFTTPNCQMCPSVLHGLDKDALILKLLVLTNPIQSQRTTLRHDFTFAKKLKELDQMLKEIETIPALDEDRSLPIIVDIFEEEAPLWEDEDE